jgi:hypothetical protein
MVSEPGKRVLPVDFRLHKPPSTVEGEPDPLPDAPPRVSLTPPRLPDRPARPLATAEHLPPAPAPPRPSPTRLPAAPAPHAIPPGPPPAAPHRKEIALAGGRSASGRAHQCEILLPEPGGSAAGRGPPLAQLPRPGPIRHAVIISLLKQIPVPRNVRRTTTKGVLHGRRLQDGFGPGCDIAHRPLVPSSPRRRGERGSRKSSSSPRGLRRTSPSRWSSTRWVTPWRMPGAS